MELDEDEVVALAADKDKVQDAWEEQPPGREASVSVRRADIASRMLWVCPAPARLAPSVARQ